MILKKVLKTLLLIQLLAGIKVAFAQQPLPFYRYTTIEPVIFGDLRLKFYDTLFKDFQIFQPEFQNYSYAFQNLGQPGTALRPLAFSGINNTGFLNGIKVFSPYFFSLDDVELKEVRKPYSQLKYSQGPNEFFILEAKHSQNITPNWNVGIDFRRIRSNGEYFRQRTRIYNTRLNSWYHSRDERLNLITVASWNRLNNEESGGIVSDSLFENAPGAVRAVPVNLGNANNQVKTNSYLADLSYRFGERSKRPYYMEEANKYSEDSIDILFTKFIAGYQFRYQAERYYYKDDLTFGSNTPFYSDYFLSANTTDDSLLFRSYKNEFYFATGKYKGLPIDSIIPYRKIKAKLSLLSDQIFFRGANLETARYNNISIRFLLSNSDYIEQKWAYKINAEQFFNGYNKGDYNISARSSYLIFPQLELGVRAEISSAQPEFLFHYVLLNNFLWYNNFDPVKSVNFGAFLRFGKKRDFLIEYQNFNIQNFIYFNDSVKAVSANGNLNLQRIDVQKTFKLGNVYFKNKIIVQLSNKKEITAIPELSTYQSLYWQFKWFGSPMTSQIGLDFFYNSSYTAMAYNPALRAYHTQSGVQIGNYPQIDLFLTGRVYTFDIFLKFTHVNTDLNGRKYYSSPHYPIQPRMFNFGVRWTLAD